MTAGYKVEAAVRLSPMNIMGVPAIHLKSCRETDEVKSRRQQNKFWNNPNMFLASKLQTNMSGRIIKQQSHNLSKSQFIAALTCITGKQENE